jgi:cytochrome c oxidase assembly protein Cox11
VAMQTHIMPMQQSSMQSQKLVQQSWLPFKRINNVKIIVAWTNILKLGDAKFYFKKMTIFCFQSHTLHNTYNFFFY